MRPNDNQDSQLRRIIVIDDNPDIQKDYTTILDAKPDHTNLELLESQIFGHRESSDRWYEPRFKLDFASQGQQGAEKVKEALNAQKPYQLAFVDMRMPPGWDGLQTIKEIWRIDPEIQIVLCTAYSDYSWEEINRRLGVTQNLLILKKPFDSSEVAQLASTLTQKWELAKQAKQKQDELERLVNHRTKALRASNQQLKQEMAERKALEEQLVRSQKMEAIGTLAAGVAHDLNNILSGILSYPDLLLMRLPEDDPLYRPLSVIRRSGLKAAAIVQDMLTLARRNVAVKEPVYLNTVIEKFIDSPEFRSILNFHPDTKLDPRIIAELPPVFGSVIHLEKMITNLISNAAEAMNDGGTITIELKLTKLADPLPGYKTVEPGNYIKLSVTDQGVGIHKDDLDHIFEPFFTKKKMGRSGTGLGMTVVWDTVTNHDGYIKVNSNVGVGTAISVFLPITDQVAKTQVESQLENDLNGHGEHILVVDDVEEQREIATEIFKELGYKVEAVSSGETALAYLDTQPADLLVLDMIMDPGIDGLETYRRVLSQYPNQKAVIASGYTKSKRVLSAIKLGAIFLHKPYRLEEIAKAAKKALHTRKSTHARKN